MGTVLWQRFERSVGLGLAAGFPVDVAAPARSSPDANRETEDTASSTENDSESEASPPRITMRSDLFPTWIGLAGGGLAMVCVVLGAIACYRSPSAWLRWSMLNMAALFLTGIYLRDVLDFAPDGLFENRANGESTFSDEQTIWRGRNFYGALKIEEHDDSGAFEGGYRSLQHGRIVHGSQYLDEPAKSQPPLTIQIERCRSRDRSCVAAPHGSHGSHRF